MELGFTIEAAKVKQPHDPADQPAQVPMRPQGQIRRNPSTDQKKVRHQIAKSAVVLSDTEKAGLRQVPATDLKPGDRYFNPSMGTGLLEWQDGSVSFSPMAFAPIDGTVWVVETTDGTTLTAVREDGRGSRMSGVIPMGQKVLKMASASKSAGAGPYIIVGMDGDDPSFWSNSLGWVQDRSLADEFSGNETLPQGSFVSWMPASVTGPDDFGSDFYDTVRRSGSKTAMEHGQGRCNGPWGPHLPSSACEFPDGQQRTRCPDCYGGGMYRDSMGQMVPCERCDSTGTVRKQGAYGYDEDDETPECPDCGSENTRVRGTDGFGEPRFSCMDCGFDFSLGDVDDEPAGFTGPGRIERRQSARVTATQWTQATMDEMATEMLRIAAEAVRGTKEQVALPGQNGMFSQSYAQSYADRVIRLVSDLRQAVALGHGREANDFARQRLIEAYGRAEGSGDYTWATSACRIIVDPLTISRPEWLGRAVAARTAAGDPEMQSLVNLYDRQGQDLRERGVNNAGQPPTTECRSCGAEATFDKLYRSFPAAYANYICPQCHKETHLVPAPTPKAQASARTAGISIIPDNVGARDFFTDQLVAQIGGGNILAISGGRVQRIIAPNGKPVGISLPVTQGYSVDIYLANDDTYTVQRMFRGRLKGQRTGVYAEEVGEAAYQASLFRDGTYAVRQASAGQGLIERRAAEVARGFEGQMFPCAGCGAPTAQDDDNWGELVLCDACQARETQRQQANEAMSERIKAWREANPGADGDPEWARYSSQQSLSAQSSLHTAMPAPGDLGVQVGDIFYNSWGYDQTNIDFYEVIRLTGQGVEVQPVASRVISDDGHGNERVVPMPGVVRDYDVILRIDRTDAKPSKVCRLKDGWNGTPTIVLQSGYHWAQKWDGTPKRQTASGWGH